MPYPKTLLDLHGATLLGLVLLRVLPFFAYAIASRRFRIQTKLLAVAVVGGWGVLTWQYDPMSGELMAHAPSVFGYFVAAVVLSIAARRALLGFGRLCTFAALAVLFVLVPAILSFSQMRGFAVASGWEMMLSSYSICVDGYKAKQSPTVAEHAFFVLVNPVLVYPERGLAIAPGERTTLVRCIAGPFTILIGRLATSGGASLIPVAWDASWLGACLLLLIGTYWQHSGLASLQIGLMRLVGFQVPERYEHPLWAKTPMEFWRRWNTYVGSWARRYVFSPLALHLARPRRLSRDGVAAIGVVTTFVVVGVLHEFGGFATSGDVSLRWLAFFASQGVLVVCWEGARRLAASFVLRFARSNSVVKQLLAHAGRAATLSTLLVGLAVVAWAAKFLHG